MLGVLISSMCRSCYVRICLCVRARVYVCVYRAVASGVLGGAEHPRAAEAAPVLRMARSTPS